MCIMFFKSLWESKSHSLPFTSLCAVPIVFAVVLFFVFISLNLTLVGGIVAGVIILATIVPLIVWGKELRWYNPKHIFAFNDEGILFTSTDTQNSYFSDTYENIEGYNFTPSKKGYTTVVVYLKEPSSAGMYGKIKYIKMVNIENFETVQKIFEDHNIPVVEKRK